MWQAVHFNSQPHIQYLTQYFISQLSCHSTNFHFAIAEKTLTPATPRRCRGRGKNIRLKIQFEEIDLCSDSIFMKMLFLLWWCCVVCVCWILSTPFVSDESGFAFKLICYITSRFTLPSQYSLFCLSCNWMSRSGFGTFSSPCEIIIV